MKNKKEQKKFASRKRTQPFGLVFSLAGTLLVVLYFGYHLGCWIDTKLSIAPIGLILTVVLGIGVTMKIMIQDIMSDGRLQTEPTAAYEDKDEWEWI